MDEVGFMVSEISQTVLSVWLKSVAGTLWWLAVNALNFFTRDGREIPVISGSVPPHLTRGKGGPTMPAISDIIFDGGFADKAEAESFFGIRRVTPLSLIAPYLDSQ